MSEYIKKLENILEGVENYRFDDANVDEWKELTISVLKGAIAREKANQEADELAYSIWNKLANLPEPKLSEPKLNENQESVLKWMITYATDECITPIDTVASFWRARNRELQPENWRLTKEEQAQVLQVFATWAIDQC